MNHEETPEKERSGNLDIAKQVATGLPTARPEISTRRETSNTSGVDSLVTNRFIVDASGAVTITKINRNIGSDNHRSNSSHGQDKSNRRSSNHTIRVLPGASERITIKSTGQLRNGKWTETRTETCERIATPTNSEAARSKPSSIDRSSGAQNAMSHIFCADMFCQAQIPQKNIVGRWACCERCAQKTCIMSLCGRLEAGHYNPGAVCPDGAAALGLERIARQKGWERCKECKCMLVKEDGEKGKNLPCSSCSSPDRVNGVVGSSGGGSSKNLKDATKTGA